MNILMVCGGSGGHIAPAIAVAERLSTHRCTFVVSGRRVDELFSQKYTQFEFISIDATPFSLSPLALSHFIRSQMSSFKFARKFLKEKKIDLVISFGGFTSVGFVLAAKLQKIPVILHESNMIPGKSTRVLARFANKVLLPHDVFLKGVNTEVEHIGYPIRKEFVNISKADARQQLGWPALKKIILIIGGSNGALALNKWAEQNFHKFTHRNIDIFCIAGTSLLQEQFINCEDCTLHMLPFCDKMNLALYACDFIIARAGAGTVAECRYCKKPMILVPYPFAADNHQRANAKAAEALGVATVVDQDDVGILANRAIEIISEHSALIAMQKALDATFEPYAAEQFAEIVESVAKNNQRSRKK